MFKTPSTKYVFFEENVYFIQKARFLSLGKCHFCLEGGGGGGGPQVSFLSGGGPLKIL